MPRFYPAGTRQRNLLAAYAARLAACELNNTFYQQPSADKVTAWLAATPEPFRFAVKAQRGGSMRSLAGDPAQSVPWLTGPLRAFGERLGVVLFRVPDTLAFDAQRLDRLLEHWPPDLPLALEARQPSWQSDEVTGRLAAAGGTLVATDLPDAPVPVLRRTSSPLYVRLRREDYAVAEIERWADRLAPFLEAGDDAYVFFRHDAVGRAGELALALNAAVRKRLGPAAIPRHDGGQAPGLRGGHDLDGAAVQPAGAVGPGGVSGGAKKTTIRSSDSMS